MEKNNFPFTYWVISCDYGKLFFDDYEIAVKFANACFNSNISYQFISGVIFDDE